VADDDARRAATKADDEVEEAEEEEVEEEEAGDEREAVSVVGLGVWVRAAACCSCWFFSEGFSLLFGVGGRIEDEGEGADDNEGEEATREDDEGLVGVAEARTGTTKRDDDEEVDEMESEREWEDGEDEANEDVEEDVDKDEEGVDGVELL
jgi:hypothetical protein